MYETAYSTRNDSIRPTNGQSYTWYDLRGDVMHDIYNKARSKLAHNWANRIAGRPYAGLYEACAIFCEHRRYELVSNLGKLSMSSISPFPAPSLKSTYFGQF